MAPRVESEGGDIETDTFAKWSESLISTEFASGRTNACFADFAVICCRVIKASDTERTVAKMNQSNRSNNGAGAIRLSGHLICTSSEEIDTIRNYLPEHIRLTRSEPGCLSFEVTQTVDPIIWRVEERFADRATFEAHQARTRASTWGTATRAIRREYEISEDS